MPNSIIELNKNEIGYIGGGTEELQSTTEDDIEYYYSSYDDVAGSTEEKLNSSPSFMSKAGAFTRKATWYGFLTVTGFCNSLVLFTLYKNLKHTKQS